MYVVPRDLCSRGRTASSVRRRRHGGGTLNRICERVVDAGIDAQYQLSLAALGELTAAGELSLAARSGALDAGGATRTFEDRAIVSVSELPALFSASGPSGEDRRACRRPSGRRCSTPPPCARTTCALRPSAPPPREPRAAPTLGTRVTRCAGSRMARPWWTASLRSSRVAEGQFAFVPKVDDIMAEITRKAPDFRSRYTVVVQQRQRTRGRRLGRRRAAGHPGHESPTPTNADTFDYRQTQILAGSRALPVAQDIRAILGRGVVLDGADVPPDTVVVIVGADTEPTNTEPKDQP